MAITPTMPGRTGLQDWSVKEGVVPSCKSEIKTANGTTAVAFTHTTRALMPVAPCTATADLILTLASGSTLTIPKANVNPVFAPGSILPLAVTSFKFSAAESTFKIVGLF